MSENNEKSTVSAGNKKEENINKAYIQNLDEIDYSCIEYGYVDYKSISKNISK